MIISAVLIFANTALAQAALPPYEVSIRCAGLAEAEVRRKDAEKLPSSREFDAAIFWGMAASEAAREKGLPSTQFTKDQERAADKAMGALHAKEPHSISELASCIARVPPRSDP